jgi:hypothetical protein
VTLSAADPSQIQRDKDGAISALCDGCHLWCRCLRRTLEDASSAGLLSKSAVAKWAEIERRYVDRALTRGGAEARATIEHRALRKKRLAQARIRRNRIAKSALKSTKNVVSGNGAGMPKKLPSKPLISAACRKGVETAFSAFSGGAP